MRVDLFLYFEHLTHERTFGILAVVRIDGRIKSTGGRDMRKYSPLWHYIRDPGEDSFPLTFGQIQDILGFPIDHSFLYSKKELMEYGYQVGQISMKQQMDAFEKRK